jgi:hypothetical protein
MSITNPTDYEMRSVIQFLNTKNIRPAEILRQLVKVYGEVVMNKGNMCKWCRLFNGGKTDVHNEARSGRPSVIIVDLKEKIHAHVCENTRSNIDEPHEFFQYVSRSVLYEAVIVKLRYRKTCSMWVPRIFTD